MQFLQHSPSFTHRVQTLVSDSSRLLNLWSNKVSLKIKVQTALKWVVFSDLLSSYLKSCLRVMNCQSPIREVQTYFKVCEQSRETIMIMVPGTPRKWIDGPASLFEQVFPSSSSSRSSWSQYTSQCLRWLTDFSVVGWSPVLQQSCAEILCWRQPFPFTLWESGSLTQACKRLQ